MSANEMSQNDGDAGQEPAVSSGDSKRTRESPSTSPSAKRKPTAEPTEGDIPDATAPSGSGNATDFKQQNPNEAKKQVQPNASPLDEVEIASISNNRDRELGMAHTPTENQLQELLQSSTSTGSSLQNVNIVIALNDNAENLFPANRNVDDVSYQVARLLATTREALSVDLNNASSQPQGERVVSNPAERSVPNSEDVPPIEISSDEGEREDIEDNGEVLTIFDSDEEQSSDIEETSDTDEEETQEEEETQDEEATQDEEETQDEDETQEEEEEEEPENDEVPEPIETTHNALTVAIGQVRSRLASLTELSPRVRVSEQFIPQAKDFQVLHLIGVGAFGRVVVVRKTNGYDSGRVYAMKAISKVAAIHSLQTAKHVKSERQVLEAVQGTPFLVCLQYAFQDRRYLYLVMNFVQGGEMYRRVQTYGALPEPDVILYIAEVTLALEYLHEQNILYRDLKLENILIDNSGHIVLADLGLSTTLTAENNFRERNFCGTLEYMAPEMLRLPNRGYGKPIDWWSMGVVLIEMLGGISPFTNQNLPRDQQKVETERRILHEDPEIPSWFCHAAVDLATKLLDKNEHRRMKASGIWAHPFFETIDWTRLRGRGYSMPFLPNLSSTDDVRHFDPEFTSQPAVVPETEQLPFDLQVYKDYEYASPQVIDWARLCQHQDDEYSHLLMEENLSRPPAELVLKSRLYSGSTSICFLTSQNTIAKVIHLSKFRAGEVDALMELAHRHIVRYLGTYRNRTEIWIVMEHLSGQNLKWWIKHRSLVEPVSREIFVQIVKALIHVHSRNFIHGDVKPSSVVCEHSKYYMDFKLAGFSYASYSSTFTEWEGKARYTIDYAPPELLADTETVVYSPAVDVYGLGATLYCMVVGHPPFRFGVDDVDDSPEIRQLLKENIKRDPFNQTSEKWLSATQEFRDLVSACLRKEPAARPKLCEILNSEWMKREFSSQPEPALGARGAPVTEVDNEDVDVDVGEEVPVTESQISNDLPAPHKIGMGRRYTVG